MCLNLTIIKVKEFFAPVFEYFIETEIDVYVSLAFLIKRNLWMNHKKRDFAQTIMFTLSVSNIRSSLIIIQAALIVILTLDGVLLDNLSILMDTFGTTKLPRIWFVVGIILLINQCLKITTLSVGLHLNHIRLIKTAARLDALNAVLFVTMLMVLLELEFAKEKPLAVNASCHWRNSSGDPYFQYFLRHGFGFVFSILSASATSLLLDKLRRVVSDQTTQEINVPLNNVVEELL